jgi:hypothetical protein
MRRRSLERRLLKLNGCFLLLRLGMTGSVPRSFNHRPTSALSEALSPITRFDALPVAMSRSATGQSCASPPVRKMARRRPRASARAWTFVLRPPLERPIACSRLFQPLPSGAL